MSCTKPGGDTRFAALTPDLIVTSASANHAADSGSAAPALNPSRNA